MSRYLGVDLGGTGTRIVALDADGRMLGDATASTPREVSADEAVAALADSLAEVAEGEPVAGIGIGASGPVDPGGVIRNPATLPAYTGVPIATMLGERFGVPCRIDNDAVTAALGEYRFGAAAGSGALLMVTLGTGVGVTMLTLGRPYRAADGSHPELGHIGVNGPAAQCYCGLPVCWEQLASRTALDTLTGARHEPLAAEARAGSAAARAVFETYGARVGVGLATLLSMFRPADVVIGGSAARYLDLYAHVLHRQLDRAPEFACTPTVVAAELGNLAGAVGAAAMVLPSGVRAHPT